MTTGAAGREGPREQSSDFFQAMGPSFEAQTVPEMWKPSPAVWGRLLVYSGEQAFCDGDFPRC